HGHPRSFFVGAPLVAQVPGQPILGACQVRISGVPFAHFHRHVELAMRHLGMLVEVARTKQMATAGFDVICLHLPRWLGRSRRHEDQQTECEKTYLFPASHIYLLMTFSVKSVASQGLLCGGRILPPMKTVG